MNKTVAVAMSGGVDSSVAAYLLKCQGYRVIGLYMHNWEETDESGVCLSEEDANDAQMVAASLGIPCYTVNFSKDYWDRVFQRFLDGYRKGRTPNPDTMCNREIKFDLLLNKALDLGADFLATGHYARIGREKTLLRGLDANKDQSYFLYDIDEKVLPKVLFPVGELPKSEVREIAKSQGFVTALKRDSTGICFIGKRSFRPFLARYIDPKPGDIETLEGRVVGKHLGSVFYTIGQRKGLGVGGDGDAWFVVGKDLNRNVVQVVQGADHSALYSDTLIVEAVNWIGPKPNTFPFDCTIKVRYRQTDSKCSIHQNSDGSLTVKLQEPVKAVTPGQAAVFYFGERCLGGGTIGETQCLKQFASTSNEIASET